MQRARRQGAHHCSLIFRWAAQVCGGLGGCCGEPCSLAYGFFVQTLASEEVLRMACSQRCGSDVGEANAGLGADIAIQRELHCYTGNRVIADFTLELAVGRATIRRRLGHVDLNEYLIWLQSRLKCIHQEVIDWYLAATVGTLG